MIRKESHDPQSTQPYPIIMWPSYTSKERLRTEPANLLNRHHTLILRGKWEYHCILPWNHLHVIAKQRHVCKILMRQHYVLLEWHFIKEEDMYTQYGWTCCLKLQVTRGSSTLKLDAASFSQAMVCIYQSTQWNISKNCNLNIQCIQTWNLTSTVNSLTCTNLPAVSKIQLSLAQFYRFK